MFHFALERVLHVYLLKEINVSFCNEHIQSIEKHSRTPQCGTCSQLLQPNLLSCQNANTKQGSSRGIPITVLKLCLYTLFEYIYF